MTDLFPLKYVISGMKKLYLSIKKWQQFLKKYESVKQIEDWWPQRINHRRFKQKQCLNQHLIPDLANIVISYL